MNYIRFELKKITGAGILIIGGILTVLAVLFQGYLGLITDAITCEVIHVTAMNLFVDLLFPIFISVVVTRSFSIEEINGGVINAYFNDIKADKYYRMKLLTVRMVNILYFVIAVFITMMFVALKGGNPFFTLIREWEWIILSIINIFTLTNIIGLLIMYTGSQLCVMIISVVATVFASVINPLGISWINPWYGFEHALFYRGLSIIGLIYYVVIFLLSEYYIIKRISKIKKIFVNVL